MKVEFYGKSNQDVLLQMTKFLDDLEKKYEQLNIFATVEGTDILRIDDNNSYGYLYYELHRYIDY